MPALVLHVFNPTDRPTDQVETWRALDVWPATDTYMQRHEPTIDIYDYAYVLRKWWVYPGDLVVVEQDIVLTYADFLKMRMCRSPVCAFDYPMDDGRSWTAVSDYGAFGAIKISLRARQAVVATPAVPRVTWSEVAMLVGERLPVPHLHTPALKHNH